jgi:hypothetical protein
MNLSFSSDPEFMLTKNGKFYSAIGIVPGTRENRHTIGDNEFYYDNVLAECAIKPGKNKQEVINNFKICFQEYANLVYPYKLTIKAFYNYPKPQLRSPEAREVGCNDEYCPYTMSQIPPPQEVMYSRKRSAGGHIHLGRAGWVQQACGVFGIGLWDAAKSLDFFVGLSSVLMDNDKTTIDRKKLYGQAGRYRKTDYGIEYRSPSNFWLASPKLVSVIYDLCNISFDFLDDRRNRDLFWVFRKELLDFCPPKDTYKYRYDVASLRKAIDNSDKNLAFSFLKKFKKWIPNSLWQEITTDSHEYDFYKEWGL